MLFAGLFGYQTLPVQYLCCLSFCVLLCCLSSLTCLFAHIKMDYLALFHFKSKWAWNPICLGEQHVCWKGVNGDTSKHCETERTFHIDYACFQTYQHVCPQIQWTGLASTWLALIAFGQSGAGHHLIRRLHSTKLLVIRCWYFNFTLASFTSFLHQNQIIGKWLTIIETDCLP